ncbi:MAG: pre-peptidase C-terminal domain-containing protein [Myxococcota bacterium]
MNSTKIRALSILALCSTGACDQAIGDRGVGNDKGVIDVTDDLSGNGKADIGKKAKVVDNVGPEARIAGTFDPRMRVYGYVIDARAGAKLNMAISAKAGADSRDLAEGEALDTVLTLYGPYKGPNDPGEQITYHDDDGDDLSAPPIDFEVPADGRYMVALSSWDDTGSGEYTVDIECQGTDFQCARPDFENPCVPGQFFVQGAEIKADATWDRCEVIMLETVTVAEDAVLTIDPGVTVKGNFLGGGNFGNVGLVVNGTMQVAGTEKDPVRFTSMKADRGWAGLTVNGPSSSMQYTYIERAQTALTLGVGASLTANHAVFEGGLPGVNDNRNGIGINAMQDTDSSFTDVLVHNFTTGIAAVRAEDMLVENSVLKNNGIAMNITGNGSTSTSCGSTPTVVNTWRDPRVINTDIIENNLGIRANGRDVLIQVEHSNLVNNTGLAFEHRGRRLHPESFLRHNNIHDNGDRQVQTSHWTNGGTLDISSNYWIDISDPELSANWRASCNGPIRFDGFSPTRLDTAGPRTADSWFAVCADALEPCEKTDGGDDKDPKPWDGLDEEETIAKNAEHRYSTPELQPGTYLFSMSGTNDADLYVRTGAAPTESNFDCRPFQGSSTETCTVELVAPAPIHVMVRGWASSSEYRLVGQEI